MMRRILYSGALLIASSAILAGDAPMVCGAPVTFRFEAEINRVFDGIPFESGIAFAVGDKVSGQFTFDPSAGNEIEISHSAAQAHQFSMNVNGVALVLSSYLLTARNNSPILDFPPASIVDGLEMNCGVNFCAALSAPTPSIDPERIGLQVYLKGSETILPGPNHPADPLVWNSFQLERQLVLSLRGTEGGTVGFQATIGQFIAVPEPDAAILIFYSITALFYRHAR